MQCSNCGGDVPSGAAACTRCGAPAPQGAAPGTIGAALDQLGLGARGEQIAAFVVAVVAGLIVARVLPYVYDPIFGRITSFFIGTAITDARDNFNVRLMTLVTGLSSAIVAFLAAKIVQLRSRP